MVFHARDKHPKALSDREREARHLLSMYWLCGFRSRPNLLKGNPSWIITSFLASMMTRGATAALGSWHSKNSLHINHRGSVIHQPPRDLVHLLLWQSSYLRSELETFGQAIRNEQIDAYNIYIYMIRSNQDRHDIRDITKICSSEIKLKVEVNGKRWLSQFAGRSTADVQPRRIPQGLRCGTGA